MIWLSFSGKQEKFATWSSRFSAYAQTKETFENLTGIAFEPIEPNELKALEDTLTNEHREAHSVATESNFINGE